MPAIRITGDCTLPGGMMLAQPNLIQLRRWRQGSAWWQQGMVSISAFTADNGITQRAQWAAPKLHHVAVPQPWVSLSMPKFAQL